MVRIDVFGWLWIVLRWVKGWVKVRLKIVAGYF